MGRRKTLGAPALFAVVAGCVAVCVAGCSGSLRSDPQPAPAAVNRAAAQVAARQTIMHVLLPPGAVLTKREPAGDHRLLVSRSIDDGPVVDPDRARVTLYAWWTVPRSVSQVLRYVGNHPSPGSDQNESGDLEDSGSHHSSRHLSFHWLGAYWPFPGKGIASRRLWVGATRLADGRTGVIAVVDVDWVVPRPTSEVVPSGVRSVVITLVRPHRAGGVERMTRVTLSTHRVVRNAIRLVDSLGAQQPIDLPCAEFPITYKCPADPVGPGSLAVAFRSDAGEALAVARVGIPVGWASTGVTGDPIRFWVHGRERHTLSGAAFVRRTLALAGLRAG